MLNRQKIEIELMNHPKQYYTKNDLKKLCGLSDESVRGLMNRIMFWNKNFHKTYIISEKDIIDNLGRKRHVVTERIVYYYEEVENVV